MQRNSFFAPLILSTLIASAFLVSCKKDKDEDPVPVPVTGNTNTSLSYSFPITNGSYWIYKQEQTDSLGNVTAVGAIDSLYVAGDSTIGAYTYKKIVCAPGPGTVYIPRVMLQLLRDSAGYLVAPDGSFIEYNNFTDTLLHSSNAGIVESYYQMNSPDSMLLTAAGTFPTVDYRGTHYITQANYPHPSPRYTHEFYADGVGMVLKSAFFLSQSGYIRVRLIRYQIQ